MPSSPLLRCTTLLLLGASLLLGGCASTMQFGATDTSDGSLASGPLDTDDPALQLVKVEDDAFLAEELEALQQSGQWGEQDGTVLPAGLSDVYDFPIVLNKQVAAYLNLFQTKQHRTFQKWLNRSGRYIPLMEKELHKAGLPSDLVYLPMIESGYSQRAYSHASAVGLWQFIGSTGRMYDLAIDRYLDERRDAEKSTAAAATFLRDLYDDFGDWHLAVAAYNAGPGKIRKGMEKYQVNTFWDLAKTDYLALETKRYVPKLIAAIIIARQPEKFGFDVSALDSPLAFDTLRVKPGLSLEAISLIADTETETIQELNQELRAGITPNNGREYLVKIPAGSRELAARNLSRLHAYASTGFTTHVSRKGESLDTISRKYDLATTALLKVNNLRSSRLKPGTKLRVPVTTVKYRLIPEGEDMRMASQSSLVLHRIKKGETLSQIARKYGVPTDLIVSWNGLKSVHSIRSGQQLALFIEGQTSPDTSARNTTIVASTTKLIKQGATPIRNSSPSRILEDHDAASSLAAKLAPVIKPKQQPMKIEAPADPYDWYRVQSGDSLWAISRKFNVSPEQIKQWNNLSSDKLKPGVRLKMKKV